MGELCGAASVFGNNRLAGKAEISIFAKSIYTESKLRSIKVERTIMAGMRLLPR